MDPNGVSSPRRRSSGSADLLPDDASRRTSSVGTVAPDGAVSPSFEISFMELQRQLQRRSARSESENLDYIRVLQSCLSGSTGPHLSPCSRSTASSDEEVSHLDLGKQHRRRTGSCSNNVYQCQRQGEHSPTSHRCCRLEGIGSTSCRSPRQSSHGASHASHGLGTNLESTSQGDGTHNHDGNAYRHDTLGTPSRMSTCNTNVIFLDDERGNARLEVSLRKLRAGLKGQQRLLRLHRVGSHLELEYSEAVEDLELSFTTTEPIAASSGVREHRMAAETTTRSHWQETRTAASSSGCADPKGQSSHRALLAVAGVVFAAVLGTLYFRNRTSLAV